MAEGSVLGVSDSAAPASDAGGDAGSAQVPQEQAAPETATPAAPAAWEFEFGGRKFNDQKQAQDYFQSWNGRLAASDRRFNEARDIVGQWDGWYQQNKAKIDAALNAPAAEGGAEAAQDLWGQLDWEHVQDLVKEGKGLEAVQYLQWKSSEYLQEQVKSLREELRNEFSESLAPIQTQAAAREYAVDLMMAAKDSTDADGNVRFPEFQEGTASYNPEFVSYFGNVWRSLPSNLAFDPGMSGVELAYLRTKQAFDGVRSAVAGAGAAATQAVRGANGKFVKQTEQAAAALGGSERPPTEEPGDEVAAFKRSIRDAGKKDKIFGVRQ